MNKRGIVRAVVLAGALSCIQAGLAKDKDLSDFTASRADVNRRLSWTLGPTGMRGCMSKSPKPPERFPGEGRISFLHGDITSTSRQILVIDVGPNTPADGVMKVDDVILGAGGKPFTSDARQSLARAIQEAEKEENKGVLKLTRWREGKTEEVELTLKVMGTYSGTAPCECPKSKRIFEEACKVLALENPKDAPSRLWSINGLALLATGDPQYLPMVQEYARKLAPQDLHLEGCDTWKWGYDGLLLCEYYLLSRDQEVLHGIREHTMALAKGHGKFGTFGHGGSIRTADGRLHGSIPWYGPVNQAGLGANLAIVMGKKCGIEDPEVDAAIERATRFFAYYVDKGTIPYGEHEPGDIHDNNGKSAMAAMFFALQGNHVPEARFFAKMTTAGYLNREIGHTGQGFSYLWTVLGANVGGPQAAAAFFKEASWHLDLVRRCDGDFSYDGGEQSGPGEKDGKDNTYFGKARYGGISPAATYVLTYSLPLKKLCITGRESKPETWLTQKDVSDAIASGRFHRDRANKSPRELVAAFGDWSPVVRGWAGDELALRPEAPGMVPELITLAEGSDAHLREGACQALGGLKDASALPVLGRRLSDPDLWVRAKAAKALKNFGAAAKPELNTMLKALVSNGRPAEPIDWTDPLQFSNGFLADAVFKGPLAKEISVAPKDLLYPAVAAGLELPAGMWRASTSQALRENLGLADIQALAPVIFKAIREQGPADRMFTVIPPGDGMKALAKYHFEEGIQLSCDNAGNWGAIRDAALEVLPKYGDEARWTLPRLQELLLKWNPQSDEYKRLVRCIDAIRNATSAPPLASCLPAATPRVVATDAAKAITLTGTAPDNAPLTYAIVDQPAHGTLTGTPPTVTYTPAAGYRGTDRFTFTVRNGTLESPPGTVSLIVGSAGTGLKGEYLSNRKRVVTRIDPTLNFDWGGNAPDKKINAKDFAVRWTGQVLAPETGTYVFSTLNSGAVRLWINGIQVINDYRDRPLRWNDGSPVSLVEGQRYDIRLQFFKKTAGPAMMKLKWTGPSFAGRGGSVIDQEWLYSDQTDAESGTAVETLAQMVVTPENRPKVIVLTTGQTISEPLAYAIISQPEHGSLAGQAPTLTYTPAPGFVGADRFTYRVTRGEDALPDAIVGVTVVADNAAPSEPMAAGKASSAAMLTFGLPDQPATIIGTNIIWPVQAASALDNLAPVFTLIPGATCNKASGSNQDFTTSQTYIVTDARGDDTLYRVTAAKMVIDAGSTRKINDEKQLGGTAVIMKGGTMNPTCELSHNITMALAPETTSTIDSSPSAPGSLAVGSTITGNGSLVVAGARAVAMSSRSSDYSGGTRITLSSGAKLLVGGDKPFGTGLVTFAGTGGPIAMSVAGSNPAEIPNDLHLESDVVYSQTYNNIVLSLKGDISGPGSLTKTFDPQDKGTRLVLLGKNSTYSGGTIFKSGYLDVLCAGSLGSGPVTMGGKASPEHVVAFVNLSPMTVANNVVLAGISEASPSSPEAPAEFRVGQNLEISGGISGTGGLLKTGPKTLTLSGANTGTGPTRVEAGELAAVSVLALGTGPLEIADEAKVTLDYQGTRQVSALSVAGKTLPPGTYGSSDSPATNKDDKHFSGGGTVTVKNERAENTKQKDR